MKIEYYHNSVFSLEINKSSIVSAGLGVFSLENIPKDTFIDYYLGDYVGLNHKVRKHDYYGIKLKKNTKKSLFYFEIEDNIGIDATEYPRCYMAMINDIYGTDKEINVEFREIKGDIKDLIPPKIGVWTIKNIKKGDELFASYGNDYWTNLLKT